MMTEIRGAKINGGYVGPGPGLSGGMVSVGPISANVPQPDAPELRVILDRLHKLLGHLHDSYGTLVNFNDRTLGCEPCAEAKAECRDAPGCLVGEFRDVTSALELAASRISREADRTGGLA